MFDLARLQARINPRGWRWVGHAYKVWHLLDAESRLTRHRFRPLFPSVGPWWWFLCHRIAYRVACRRYLREQCCPHCQREHHHRVLCPGCGLAA